MNTVDNTVSFPGGKVEILVVVGVETLDDVDTEKEIDIIGTEDVARDVNTVENSVSV